MTVLKDISLEAKNIAAIFEATGAEVVEMDFLQISNLLLDLYGEDIRGFREYPLRTNQVKD